MQQRKTLLLFLKKVYFCCGSVSYIEMTLADNMTAEVSSSK